MRGPKSGGSRGSPSFPMAARRGNPSPLFGGHAPIHDPLKVSPVGGFAPIGAGAPIDHSTDHAHRSKAARAKSSGEVESVSTEQEARATIAPSPEGNRTHEPPLP